MTLQELLKDNNSLQNEHAYCMTYEIYNELEALKFCIKEENKTLKEAEEDLKLYNK